MTVVVAAAGTGGHVYPALAVGEALVARGLDRSEVVFFGGRRLAAQVFPAAGFPFIAFDLPRLRRSWTVDNLRIPGTLRRTTRAMAAEIDRHRATVVVGMSGYVTVPAARAARRSGVRFLLQEQNASPGLASRFASRRAEATFLGLPGPSERLPRSRLVGNPLRPALLAFDRDALREQAVQRYRLDGRNRIVGVLGGSLGARVLNEMVPALAAAVEPDAVLHLAGPDMTGDAGQGPVPWRCLPYEDSMEYFYAAVDLVVCRAGAMTVSELAATGTPSLLVPLEMVGQQGNAAAMAAAGGAVVMRQAGVSEVPSAVAGLLGDVPQLAAMGAAARGLHRGDAAGVVADAVLEGYR